jgi:cytochrome P450
MTDLTDRDYFTDFAILRDPYPYFEAIAAQGDVFHDKRQDIYFVTGFEAARAVLLDAQRFSSAIAVNGPVGLPDFGTSREAITAGLAKFRAQNPLAQLLVNYDGEEHAAVRSLLSRLFTPSRLKANEEFMAGLAAEMVGQIAAAGQAEIVKGLAAPYVTLVIADLLGVPGDDREKFREAIDNGPPAGNMTQGDDRPADATLIYLGGFFMRYISERRAKPCDDVMSELATASYPDGSTPELLEVVKAAMFLFAAGQDTSAKLLGNAVRHLCEHPELQGRLRAEPAMIGPFIEEMLRLEGSTKVTFRLTLEDVELGGTAIPAGKPVVVAIAAANRDPARWSEPEAFRLDRKDGIQHLAFGRGPHTCIGAALARAEVKALLQTLLQQTSAITLDEEKHGPAAARELVYEPSYIIRGLDELHVRLAR